MVLVKVGSGFGIQALTLSAGVLSSREVLRRTLKLIQGWVLFLNKGRETRAEDTSPRKGAVKKEKLSQTGERLPEGIESMRCWLIWNPDAWPSDQWSFQS